MKNRFVLLSIAMLVMFTGNAFSTTTFTKYDGNDNNNATFLGVLENLGYEFWGKIDVEGGSTGNSFTLNTPSDISGSWDSGVTNIVGFTYKAGNEFVFVNYGIDNQRTSDNWCTNAACLIGGLNPLSITNKKGNAKDLSHISLYTASPVPEASTIAMLLLGTGFVAFISRRKNKYQ